MSKKENMSKIVQVMILIITRSLNLSPLSNYKFVNIQSINFKKQQINALRPSDNYNSIT
jgi:hypothetical protein